MAKSLGILIEAVKNSARKRIWTRSFQGTLLVLLAGIALWGAEVNNPKLLLDLAGSWEVCPGTEESTGAECHWRAATVPAPFVARSDDIFTNYIYYRHSFDAPSICLVHSCKLIFAEVGDSADVELNGVLLRQSVPEDRSHVYEKNFPLGVDLPPALLNATSENQLLVRVHSFRDQQVGLRTGPVGIATNRDGNMFLQWRAFRNVYVPLTCSIVAAVVAFLCVFLPHAGVNRKVWRSFYAYATASAIFMFSFTEIPRSLWPLSLVIPAHFILRFYTDFALFRLIMMVSEYDGGWLWRAACRSYCVFISLFGLLFVAGLGAQLIGVNWIEPRSTFTFVLFAYPLSAVFPVLTGIAALRSRRVAVAGVLFAAATVVLHEWIIGSGFWQGEFVSKYHHLIATGAFLVLLVRRAARAQAEQEMALAAERELARLARQVDHDIRSPLAALDVASRNLANAPENIRSLVCMAVDRIRDIANSLRQRQGSQSSGWVNEPSRPILLVSLVEGVVSEKRVTCANRLQRIEHRVSSEAYSVFVEAPAGMLRRVLSNLLNNAVEAVGQDGRVLIEVGVRDGKARVTVTDNGPGIPEQVLARWGDRGMTMNKAGGSGLGVNHAVESIALLGGAVCARNLEREGAEVAVVLPLCDLPSWFVPQVHLQAGQTVVVVDDDRAVHAAWRERLQSMQVAMVHISSVQQLQHWLDAKPDTPITYFIDYELGDSACNGMTIIKQWPLEGDAYLVTSHFETPDVVEQCEAQEIVMMPKSLVGVVPLECQVGAMG